MSILGALDASKTLRGLEGPRQESQDLRDLRSHMRDSSLRSRENLVDDQLAGAQQAAQPFVQSQDTFQSGLAMQPNPAVEEALARRGQKIFDRDYTDLKRQLQLEAPSYQQQRMQSMMPAMAQKAQADIELRQMKSQNEAARKAARNNVIGSITGTLGTLAGAGIGAAVSPGARGQGAQFGAQMGGSIFK